MIKIAENALLKKYIYRACEQKLDASIADLKDRIQSLLQTEGLGNEEAYDNHTLADTAQQMSEVDALTESLDFVSDQRRQLERMKTAAEVIHHVVEPGAAVITNAGSFFIAVGVESFQVQEKTYTGLSSQSALFAALQGKKAGSVARYHGTSYTIKKVF